MCPELGTLERDTFNPINLIQISNVDTYNLLFNPLFLGYSTEKLKTGCSKLENSHFCTLILNGGQHFKFIRFLYTTLIDRIVFTVEDSSTRLG